MMFTIIVVALNPGDKLEKTVRSILTQTNTDYEILIKDGMSTDGSIANLQEQIQCDQELERIKIVCQPDKSIYDAMNQAVELARGEYVCFLNCGDTFPDSTILATIAKQVHETVIDRPKVFYGDTLSEITRKVIYSAPKIDGFTCYRNIPCHQSCFYQAILCKEKPYDVQYRIRADYEHFLWCYYRKQAAFIYVDKIVSGYEGGGYSESKENMLRNKEEHKLITEAYMTRIELFKYRAAMILTLAPLRSKIASNPRLAGIYEKVVRIIYRQ